MLNELGSEIKCDACRGLYPVFTMSLIYSIVQEPVLDSFLISHITNNILKSLLWRKNANRLPYIRDAVVDVSTRYSKNSEYENHHCRANQE